MATDSLDAINNLVSMLNGGKSTTTQTSSTGLNNSTVLGLINQILGSTQGLSSLLAGQANSGMYNSTVNSQLANDLLSRVTTQVAAEAAPKTTTTTTQKANLMNSGSNLGTLGALMAGKYLWNKIGAGDKLDNVVNSLFYSGASATNALSSLGISPTDFGNAVSSSMGTGALSGLSDALGSSSFGLGDILSNTGTSLAADTALNASDMLPDFSKLLDGTDIFGGAGALATDSASSALDIGSSLASMDVPWFTAANLGSGVLENAIGNNVASNVVGGLNEAVGGFFDTVGSALGGLFGGGGGCFLTTVVCEHLGKSDDCEELNTLRAFRDSWLKDNHPEDIKEYYENAPRLVSKLKALDYSDKILEEMWKYYIVPSINFINRGDNQSAYDTYKNLYGWVKYTVGEENG